ncbi:MAG: hypothetical protein R6V19_08735 [Armatimonadota bacterium]
MKTNLRTAVVISVALILLAGGIWLAGRHGPSDVSETTSTPPRVVPEAWEAREAHSASQQDTDSATVENADETEQNAGDGEAAGVAEGGSSLQADESTTSESAGEAPQPSARASRQVGEEEFINLSVDIIITAMAMKNSGKGAEALQEYTIQLLEDQGYSPAGFEEATQQIANDEEQARRVTREILKRVRVKTGVQMDMKVIPLLNPGLKDAIENSDGGPQKPPADSPGQ